METKNSSWIVQVHDALEKDEANDVPSQLLIWKVPPEMRTITKQYEPLYWRFGLHHCPQSFNSNGIEGLKVEVARALQFRGDRWDSFCKRVVIEQKEYWEAVYRDSIYANSYTIEEIRCRLSLDALFLVVDLQGQGGGVNSLGLALQKVMKNPVLDVYSNLKWEAFWLVENQIPIELLERVVNILVTECKDYVGKMQEWESEDWQVRNIGKCVWCLSSLDPLIDDTEKREVFKRRINDRLQHADSYRGVHILDSTYRMLCGSESLGATHVKSFPLRYSAIDLEACGVTIKGKEFTCFEDISFDKGCLLVPFLQVYDETETFLRNLVVHESLTRPNGRQQYAARCYTSFMGGLMRTREDVILLEKSGVISVEVGSHDIVVDMWKRLNYNILVPHVTDKFFTMMTNVSNYTKRKRNIYRFEFKKKFCSRPWIPLSYLAAIIVTIATLIQTYATIIGSNGMKPHFAPQH